MQVTTINQLNQFEQIKTAWDAVYSADSHAQIFLSWAWLRGWFEVTPNPWIVLAVSLDKKSPYVGFFPLTMLVVKKYGLSLFHELRMGGDPAADYTGFVCLPEYEKEAISAFAAYVQQHLRWDVLLLKDVLDLRLDSFLKCFSDRNFNVQQFNSTSCPYLPLPNTWEQYLRDFLGSKSRKNLRYALRQIESRDEFCFISAQTDNIDSQIQALLTLHQMQWGLKPESSLKLYRSIFRRCFENNRFWLNVLWSATTPVAATGIFVDSKKKTYYGYMTGYNPEFSKLSPGRVMMAYSIRHAIENGFQIYDFLRGDEDYKFTYFGAQERFNTSVMIAGTSLRGTLIILVRQLRKSLSSMKRRASR